MTCHGMDLPFAYGRLWGRASMGTSMGSGTPRQAWLNYHDERNMNHKQTEM